jgi:RND family efflux transporter MFP subunit
MQSPNLRPFLIGAAILFVGVAGTIGLIALRPDAPRVEAETLAPAVTTVAPEVRTDAIPVAGTGTVRPVSEVQLVAEVGGRIVEVAPGLVSGGRILRGELLVRIDPADYENAVAMAEAEVMQRSVDSVVAVEEAAIARQEWERVRELTGADAEPATELGSLVLREPQQRMAAAALRAARARLADARTRLARTEVRAPFTGVVRTEQAEVGQVVGPGAPLGVVYAADALEVTVSLLARETELIEGLWSAGRGASGIAARVVVDFGSRPHAWQGTIARVEGALDPATRTVGVVVRVNRPDQSDVVGGPPLLPGMFARAEILAPVAEPYAVIPAEALRENDTVWIVEGDRLAIRQVEPLYRLDGLVLVRSGLTAADRVVTSSLLAVTDGMAVRASDATPREP